jgi:hypothetical protein
MLTGDRLRNAPTRRSAFVGRVINKTALARNQVVNLFVNIVAHKHILTFAYKITKWVICRKVKCASYTAIARLRAVGLEILFWIIGRDDRIRTCDPHTPSVMRYQAALRPDRQGPRRGRWKRAYMAVVLEKQARCLRFDVASAGCR